MVDMQKQRYSVKKVFRKILQKLQENTQPMIYLSPFGHFETQFRCVFLLTLRHATLLKKRLWHRRFSVNFAKFLRAPFCIEHHWSLLLDIS